MPVLHKNVRYNCRVFCLNRKILLIRPKLTLAADGNYRENRFFSPWRHRFQTEKHYLPRIIRSVTSQSAVPFGEACIATLDTVLAAEMCEELFAPDSPHTSYALSGVEIFSNGSGSHHQLRKLNKRVELIRHATLKSGGIYVYANHQCCDGGRLYFDGCGMIFVNGELKRMSSQFSMKEVDVVTAVCDLEEVRAHRCIPGSWMEQASTAKHLERIDCEFSLTTSSLTVAPTNSIKPRYHQPEEEIAYGPACWLWDYARRCGSNGFFLPLSGGADSSSVAAIVGIMCQLVVKEVKDGNELVIKTVKRMTGGIVPETYKEVRKE